jgi:phosphoadenosine phosphosulfate reductase
MKHIKKILLELRSSQLNKRLGDLHPEEIMKIIYQRARNPLISTSFGKYSEALLSLVPKSAPDIPILWVNSGFNTESTINFSQKMKEKYQLNLIEVNPKISLSEFKKKYNTFPEYGSKESEELCKIIKLEPFKNFLSEFKPDFWFTGIRNDETNYRSNLGTSSIFATSILRIAPFITYSDVAMRRFMFQNDLEIMLDYYDPCRPENKECGIQVIEKI